MQAAVDLDLFKKHVRADDFADDDAYLAHLLATAEQAVVNETQRSREELVDMGGGQWPQPITHAIMMLGAHWYNQRESASSAQFSEVPNALQALVKPYRKLVK
ncbi:head-tail connector protein [uncultured Alloprevotella sp.]|uniref:head-tail connector protein n=1 Tax=uncultured Alloprevotella sp. TaxID=1283315 RepID=UPI0025E2B559|nr:head-tail connector protein [uncultured Alloprevotella sp.]